MVIDTIMTVVEVFHYSIVRRIAGMTARRNDSREWECALVDVEMEVTGLCPIR